MLFLSVTLLLAGSIVAMIALVAGVAGVATVTTQQIHKLFSSRDPKDKDLDVILRAWRGELVPARKDLLRLGDTELDLLALEPVADKAPPKGRLPQAGTLRTIYQEPVATFRREEFPRAKVAQSLTIVTTRDHEYVFRKKGPETLVSIDGQAFGALRQNKFYPVGKTVPTATVEPQRDGRTVHLDHGDHTVAILYRPDANRAVAPRAFEFVDVDSAEERRLLEPLAFHYLLTANSPAS